MGFSRRTAPIPVECRRGSIQDHVCTMTTADHGRPIRWDIVEEHLDEAAFLWQLWEEALRSPDYTLAEIAEGPEERLRAHLDGLVLGGPKVAEKLLLPALEGDDPGAAFAAAFALADSGRPEDVAAILEALEKADPILRSAIRRALGVVPRSELGQTLATLAPKFPALHSDLVEVLGYLRVDAALSLEPLLASNDPALQAAALRIGRVLPERLDPTAVASALTSDEAEVRSAALETALVTRVRGASSACEKAMTARGSDFGTAALLLALSGEERSVSTIASALRHDEVRGAAAFALGFTGRVSAADALLAAMPDEKLAAVAAEGFSAITGLAIEKDFAIPPERWTPDKDQEEEDEPYGPEADLPKPDPEAIARWWKAERPRFDPAQRYMRGQPWSSAALVRELEEGPARRREALALDLAIRTRGQHQIAWDAFAARQLEELSAARAGAGRIGAASYPDFAPGSSMGSRAPNAGAPARRADGSA
jgi:uncharacterized protein (TIGR02270 family)